jgi:hypothetical protein
MLFAPTQIVRARRMPMSGLDVESMRKCLRLGYLKQDVSEADRVVAPRWRQDFAASTRQLGSRHEVQSTGYFLLANPLEIMMRKKRRRPFSRSQNDCPWKPCR